MLAMSNENEKDPVIEALFHEYDQLTAYTSNIWLANFRLLPVLFTIGAAIVVYAGGKPIVIGIPYAIFFFGIWLGFIHTMGNGVGLHMLRLELSINRRLGITNDKGLSFFESFLGNPGLLPGFEWYFRILAMFTIVILWLSSLGSWNVMTSWGWERWKKIISIVFPLALDVSVLLVVICAEKRTRREKRKMVREYENGRAETL
jgi:hypothetical protein